MSRTREEQIAGIRQLADLLEEHPEIPMPYEIGNRLTIHYLHEGPEARGRMAAAAKAIGGVFDKRAWSGSHGQDYFDLNGHIGTIPIQLSALRDDVCERVVTGVREVTEEVPDPEKLAEVPTVTVTKVVEDVEWVCGSVLAGAK